ncbi:Peptidoglycan/xylan/chitin deacetylase, PgdA/CDA1 family [Zunongwangia mangrovi]|uniref:Peptidoglycan/xylan/chitin deacetylase, PgdA/CDA1 family n=1 Tax=Zunongwangia mangrovi TaxID=1334022 RepID=A0A1I1DB08_9FLAO|nr:polysaccharide deacetylase family protein [Zunongwangia mangrovi]SFB70268.1 Peptidoglycan/xylan/chitin deacetylase, PgdA/CDA1 family [Zunongwangia mangrovi]
MNRLILKYPWILKKLYPKRLSRITAEKTLFLTFDDGPIPEITPWVLGLLEKHSAKATFFCIGDNVRKHPEVFEQIKAKGHAFGNHTFNHLDGWKTKTSDYIENFKKAEEIIESQLQQKLTSEEKLFRPPYGKIKNKQAAKIANLGYKIVMWDVITGDYDKNYDAEECLKNTRNLIRSGSIIVFHDSLKAEKNLKYVLPKLLEEYTEKGWKFESLF